MDKLIYLDNAATTKILDSNREILNQSFNDFYNPSSAYKQGIFAKKQLDESRVKMSKLLGGENGKFIFTSRATESNNTVFAGIKLRQGQKVLISKAEHPSVYLAAHRLEESGITVEDLPLNSQGQVDFEKYKKMFDKNVALISVMHVSNETGAINNIKQLCEFAKLYNPKIIFHCDGVQAFGKIDVNVDELGVDLYSVSAHKVYAPRGIAGLWIKNSVQLKPLLVGGGQEFGLRSSTENLLGAICFAKTAECVVRNLETNNAKVEKNRRNLLDLLQKSDVKDYFLVNSCESQSPYILSLSFDGIKGEVLANALELDGILISTGSACSSKKAGNRTLEAMGKKTSEVVGSVRISFSAYDDYDVKYVADAIIKNVLRLMKNVKK